MVDIAVLSPLVNRGHKLPFQVVKFCPVKEVGLCSLTSPSCNQVPRSIFTAEDRTEIQKFRDGVILRRSDIDDGPER